MGMRDFPGGPEIRTLPSNIVGAGLIPGQGARIPCGQKTKTWDRNSVVADLIKTLKKGPQQQQKILKKKKKRMKSDLIHKHEDPLTIDGKRKPEIPAPPSLATKGQKETSLSPSLEGFKVESSNNF